MKQTGDLNLVKKINKSLVLDHLRRHSPVSRARIAELTGLTKATVSSLVSELIDSGLAEEIGTGASSGGRKPVLLLFNGTAGYAIGVDLGVTDLLAVLTDLDGNVVCEMRVAHDNPSQDQVIGQLAGLIRDLMKQAPPSRYGIVGVGVGIPGFADEAGNLLFAPNLGWEQVPLKQKLESACGVPVVIDNEANAGAVGEQRYGAGREKQHLVYVSIGIGIGTGILIKGELYRGASGFSGELGHVSIAHDAKACRCGNIGCWELYASENALLEAARNVFPGEELSVEALLRLAEQGNPASIKLFEQTGRFLGIGIVNIINSLNPERILIGGRLAAAETWLREPLLREMERRSLPYPRARLDVQFSELGIRSTVLGAASFAISRFFNQEEITLEA